MSDRPNLAGRLWYDCVFWSSFTFFTFGFSLRRAGWNNVPKKGPLLVVSNHQSMFDPVLVGLSSRRYLSYLARKNLFEQPVLAPLIRSLNAIPIDRGMGKDGIQAVLEALGHSQAVLVFPEGERTHDGTVEPLKPGVSLLIKRVCCPIIPVGIAGAFRGVVAVHEVAEVLSAISTARRQHDCSIGGSAIDPARYEKMKREAMMDDLHKALKAQHAAAEQLRRK